VLIVECFHISSSTLYGVTNPVTGVTNLVTLQESLTLAQIKGDDSTGVYEVECKGLRYS